MSLSSKVTAFFLTVFLVVAFFVGCAAPRLADTPAGFPGKLAPDPNESLTMVMPAGGVQIYECRARKDGGYEWTFVAPEADLYDGYGVRIGTHYAGPSWESADGSKIVGTVKAGAAAPQAGAIPWLLLSAKSVGAEGSLSKVTSVQRVRTSGGVAPRDGCTQATVGTQARVAYTADYHFFTPSRLDAPSRDFDTPY
jgi:uncharacterized protein DUF3455